MAEETAEDRIRAVNKILMEIGIGDKEQILVFNKMDRLNPELAEAFARQWNAIPISALERRTTLPLIETLERRLFRQAQEHRSHEED